MEVLTFKTFSIDFYAEIINVNNLDLSFFYRKTVIFKRKHTVTIARSHGVRLDYHPIQVRTTAHVSPNTSEKHGTRITQYK